MSAYLAVQTLYLLSAAIGQVWGLAVHGGEEELGVGQEGVSSLQVSPQLLLHVKVSVAHLEDRTRLQLSTFLLIDIIPSFSIPELDEGQHKEVGAPGHTGLR